MIPVKIKVFDPTKYTPDFPKYMTAGSSGMDIRSAEEVLLVPQKPPKIVRTNLCVEIPEGWEIQVRPRSGLSVEGIILVPTIGTIDSDYRGEIFLSFINQDYFEYTIKPGERVAQLVLAPVHRIGWIITDELAPSQRGTEGCGSTGAY